MIISENKNKMKVKYYDKIFIKRLELSHCKMAKNLFKHKYQTKIIFNRFIQIYIQIIDHNEIFL